MSSISHHPHVMPLADVIASAPLIVRAVRATPRFYTVQVPLDGPRFKPGSPPFPLQRMRWVVKEVLKGDFWPDTVIEVNPAHWTERLSQHELACHAEHPVLISPALLVTHCEELPYFDPAGDEALLFLSGASPGQPLELAWGLMAPVSALEVVRAKLPKPAVARPWWQFW